MATQQELWQKAVSDFMGGPDYPKDPLLVVSDHNDLLLTSAINSSAARGVQASVENVKAIVRGLTEKGLLQYVQNVQPVLPAEQNIPYQDLFPTVTTVERAVKYAREIKIPGAQSASFNELLSYLRLHNIRGDANFTPPADAKATDTWRERHENRPTTQFENVEAAPRSNASARSKEVLLGRAPTTEVDDSPFRAKVQSSHKGETQEGLGRKNTENLTASERSTEYGQIVQRLSDLRPADVGSFGATSRVEKLTRFKNKWVMEISALKARSVPDGKIREKLETAISELQSTSIR